VTGSGGILCAAGQPFALDLNQQVSAPLLGHRSKDDRM
jgi:hypothetical protein